MAQLLTLDTNILKFSHDKLDSSYRDGDLKRSGLTELCWQGVNHGCCLKNDEAILIFNTF